MEVTSMVTWFKFLHKLVEQLSRMQRHSSIVQRPWLTTSLRSFLAQNNLNNKFVDPTEADVKQKPSERYFLEDLKAPKMTLIAGGTEMSDNMYIENRDHFEGLVKEL